MISRNLKVVAVGNGEVGKSCLISVFSTDTFPGEYIPTIYDNAEVNLVYNDAIYNLSIWDTAGQTEYDCLRPISYPQTDYFLICFSLANQDSLFDVLHKWVPEVRHHSRGTPIILVGTKADLRHAAEPKDQMWGQQQQQRQMISQEEGWAMAKRIGAADYVECSAAHLTNVKQVFEAGIRAVRNAETKKVLRKKKSRKICTLL